MIVFDRHYLAAGLVPARPEHASTSDAAKWRFRARSAFTLFEITLVLALLVTIAAIAWPALDGVFANERLKHTADQLRSDLTRARVAAMNTGCCHLFSWDATSGTYFVVAIDEG